MNEHQQYWAHVDEFVDRADRVAAEWFHIAEQISAEQETTP